MARVYVSAGSNIDREKNIDSALRALAAEYGELQKSSVYESDAVGFDSAPFYNLVIGFHTSETPQAVQARLHAIEDVCGRKRTSALSARTLDLDLLLYDDRVIEEGKLVLPRDDIQRYAFVLGPLAEIAGAAIHPVTGKTFAKMWADFDKHSQSLVTVRWPPEKEK